MPATKSFKCGACNLSICKSQGSINCNTCNAWIHLSCAKVSDEHLTLLRDKHSSIFFNCDSCVNKPVSDCSLRDEVRAIKVSLEEFIRTSNEDRASFKNALTEILADFKKEILATNTQIKKDVTACNELIQNIRSSTSASMNALVAENNALHRKLNRGDIVLRGLPSGVTDLNSTIISLCAFFSIGISDRDINHVCYFNYKKLILVKFNNVAVRDELMKNYLKSRSLRVCDVIGGEVSNRVYLNDHFTPAASKLSAFCRKMVQKKVISKFKVLNADKAQAKLTLLDGKEAVYDMDQCVALYNNKSDTTP